MDPIEKLRLLPAVYRDPTLFENYKEKFEQKDPETLREIEYEFKPIEYIDADLRAAAAEKFFKKVLKI